MTKNLLTNKLSATTMSPVFESVQARQTRLTVETFYTLVRERAPAAEIAALFSVIFAWEQPTESLVTPWSGAIQGRAQLQQSITDFRSLTKPKRFALVRIMVENDHAIAMGELDTQLIETGELFRVEFATHFIVKDEAIVSLRNYETLIPLESVTGL